MQEFYVVELALNCAYNIVGQRKRKLRWAYWLIYPQMFTTITVTDTEIG